MSSDKATKLHVYKLGEVIKLKQAIQEDVHLLALLGAPLDPEDFDVMTRRIHELMPPGVTKSVIRDSLLHLAGEMVTESLLLQEAWRMAGNVPRLRLGRSIQPWRRQIKDEWVPMQITEQVPKRNKRNDVGAIVTFRILAGTPCSLAIERFWTHRFCKYVSVKLGFSKPWGKYPFKKVAEFVGLRLYGLVEKEISVGRPVFDQITVPKSVEDYNRQLLRHRLRDGFKCPKNFKHPCHVCPIGHDQCPCAVHPRTFVKAMCSVCHEEKWTDPLHLELGLCIECFVKRQLMRKD